MKIIRRAGLLLVAAVMLHAPTAYTKTASLADMTRDLTPPTGILYDRVVDFSRMDRYDGMVSAPAATAREWRQMYDEIYRAAQNPPAWPSAGEVSAQMQRDAEDGVIPVAVMDFNYDRLRPNAVETGSLRFVDGRPVATGSGSPFERHRVFAAAAMKDYTYRGQHVVFSFEPAAYFTNSIAPANLEVDFDDGLGFRTVGFGERSQVYYGSPGNKNIRLRVEAAGTTLNGRFAFDVLSLAVPSPDDTLSITATEAYDGLYGSGEAYVYLAPGHSVPTQPIVAIEGFDLDNTYNWDELYAQLNQENLLEDLRAMGYDAVVLNFTDATDYIQRNAYVVAELIQEVKAFLPPQVTMVAVGASMGGLVTRYALAWMEANAIDHGVRTFIAFDSPQHGANIPLGIQYWMKFFESQSTDAAHLLDRLDTPAARQMLVYHYTDPPTAPAPDPLMATLDNDLVSVGNYPSQSRLVSIINGSGTQENQGFNPSDQIILYHYSGVTGVVGDVYAVPDGTSAIVFDGSITFLGFPVSEQQVTVSGTLPYDGAPGGSRASMAQMDSVQVQYGDIIALHDSHCFIPSISGLALDNTTDPFYNIAGDPVIASHSPFDAVYYPTSNQPHVTVTAENKPWIISEITAGPTGVPTSTPLASRTVLYQNTPNPFNPTTSIRFDLAQAAHVTLGVYDARGRHIVTLLDGDVAAGERNVTWDGRDAAGRAVSSGVYFYRIDTGRAVMARKMVLLK